MQVHDRLHKGEAEANSLRAARRIGAVKAIEYAREMFGGYSRSGIGHGNFALGIVLGDGDLNPACRWIRVVSTSAARWISESRTPMTSGDSDTVA